MALDNQEKKCTPCSGAEGLLQGSERTALLEQLKGWQIVDDHHLSKTFKFSNFKTAAAFIPPLTDVAEDEGHHPDVYLSWGKVRVDIWTHKANGLTENDFILARRIDAIS